MCGIGNLEPCASVYSVEMISVLLYFMQLYTHVYINSSIGTWDMASSYPSRPGYWHHLLSYSTCKLVYNCGPINTADVVLYKSEHSSAVKLCDVCTCMCTRGCLHVCVHVYIHVTHVNKIGLF